MKINNMIKTSSKGASVLDAEGYAVCPDCDSHVNCGTIGLANLEKRHRRKKVWMILVLCEIPRILGWNMFQSHKKNHQSLTA